MSKFFTKGLIALLPIILTILVLRFIIDFLYVYVAVPIGNALRCKVTLPSVTTHST